MYCFVSIRQCKKTPTVKDAHYAIISSQKLLIRHTHSTADIAWVVWGAQQNPLEVKADVCLLGGSRGLIPTVQGADPAAGCSGSVLGTGAALAACPIPCHPMPPPRLGWSTGAGLPGLPGLWLPWPRTPGHGGSGGLISWALAAAFKQVQKSFFTV